MSAEQSSAAPATSSAEVDVVAPLHVAPSSHLVASENVGQIMLWVVAALVPTAIWAVWNMGWVAAQLLLVCILTCLGTELVWTLASRKPTTLWDCSALVTGILLAFSLPPRTPWWIAAAAGIVAIGLGKMIFGGLGWNLFNPALVGRAVALLSWLGVMARVTPNPGGWYEGLAVPAAGEYDAISGATRLAIAAADHAANGAYGFDLKSQYAPLLFRNLEGSLGEVSAALIIAGGLLLVLKGIVDWRIPLGYLTTVVILSFVLGRDPVFYALAGSVVLGAFFYATDYVTSPMTSGGRLVFGVGCGAVNTITRFYGPAPDSVMFSILFMNGLAPLIDRAFQPRTFGWPKRGAKNG